MAPQRDDDDNGKGAYKDFLSDPSSEEESSNVKMNGEDLLNDNRNEASFATLLTMPDDSTMSHNKNSERRRSSSIHSNVSHRLRRHSTFEKRQSFVVEFAQTRGPPQIVLMVLLFALGFGCTIGVVPAVMTDRFATLNYGFQFNTPINDNSTTTTTKSSCLDYHDITTRPQPCLDGSSDAQNAAAISSLISNSLTFMTGSLMGSLSDRHGRRRLLLLGALLSSLAPLALVFIQLFPRVSPWWYYGANASTGLVSWLAIALSSLSDVLPPAWRSAGFGLLLAGFSLGLGMSPTFAIFLNHFKVSCASLGLVLTGFIIILCFYPETLPPQVAAAESQRRRQEQQQDARWFHQLYHHISRPVRELSILNRNTFFRLLSALAFFSGMVTAADQTLLVYYVEERLDFNDKDVALLFSMIGIFGIVVQGVLIKPLNDWLGERWVVVLAFSIGTVVNIMYGLATHKWMVFLAISLGSLSGVSFPTISAIKSNNVEEHEQGRIQGALYSLSALASGTGPMVMRYVYSQTRNKPYPGAGTMFLVAASLYIIAILCAYALPPEKANSKKSQQRNGYDTILDLEQDDDDEDLMMMDDTAGSSYIGGPLSRANSQQDVVTSSS